MPHLLRSVFSRMQTYVDDRRYPPRLPARLVFTVSLCRKSHGKGLSPERLLKGYTRDLSEGGLALKLPQMHLDGHYLADEDREVKVKLELPTGPVSMRVSPRRHEKLEQAERGCKYLIGVRITDISDEDHKRYLSFIFPEDRQRLAALKKTITETILPENGESRSAVQTEIATDDPRSPRINASRFALNAGRPALRAAAKEQGPQSLDEEVTTTEKTSWATGWRELAWKPTYPITEISDEDRRRCLHLITPNGRSLPAVKKEIAEEDLRGVRNQPSDVGLQKVRGQATLPDLEVIQIVAGNGRALPAVRKDFALERPVSPLPIESERTRRPLAWKPVYAAAIIVIGLALVIGATLQFRRRAENLQAKEANTAGVHFPDDRTANDLSSLSTPSELPVENPESSAAMISLNDRAGLVTLDNGGNLLGLADVPAETREDIAKALLSERIVRPAILKDLAVNDLALSGSETAPPVKLISPARAVIASDRPALKWGKVAGATSYRVYVRDAAGQEIASSEELPSERSEWLLPSPLKRGESYVWSVRAVVDGKETAAANSPALEAKFHVLSARNLQQLNQVKKTGSKLALGVFYSREGIISGAEREFQALVRENPHSPVAKKLLVGVQSWHRPAANSANSSKNQPSPRAREVTVQVNYDENGRVTQAWGAGSTALRIARQKRFPAGQAGSATIRIPIN